MYGIQKLSLLGLVLLGLLVIDTYAAYDDKDLTYPLKNLCRRWDHQSAVVNNKLYLLGGRVLVKETLQKGLGNLSSTWEGEPSSEFIVLDLSKPFSLEKVDDNGNSLPKWNPIEYSIGRTIAEPLAVASGGMWSGDNKLYIYDGQHTKNMTAKDESTIWSYDISRSSWTLEKNWKNEDNALPNRFARGTSVNVPQIGMGFYVGGARLYSGKNTTQQWKYPLEQQFVEVDVGNGNYEVKYNTINKGSRKTTGAAVTWIPVGEKGSLIMIGGTDETDERTISSSKGVSVADVRPASTAMAKKEEVWIYDIAGDKWHVQISSGKWPAARMDACAVAVSAADNSSHQIFYYGGGTGTRFFGMDDINPMGDLYVLNIPSFQWIQFVDLPNPPAARTRHTCHLINNRQMMIVGGSRNDSLTEQRQWCRWDEISVLDMTNIEWQHTYKPATEPYAVNQDILTNNQYNGQPMTVPTNGWANAEVEALFTAGKKKKIAGLESGAFIGIVVGIVIIIVFAIVGFLLWRRKKNQKIKKERLEKSHEPYRNSFLQSNAPAMPQHQQFHQYGQDTPFLPIDGTYVHKAPEETTAHPPSEMPAEPVLAEMPAEPVIYELPTINESPTQDTASFRSRFVEDIDSPGRQSRPTSWTHSSREVLQLSPRAVPQRSQDGDLITMAL